MQVNVFKGALITLLVSLWCPPVLASALAFESLLFSSYLIEFEARSLQRHAAIPAEPSLPVLIDASSLQKVPQLTALDIVSLDTQQRVLSLSRDDLDSLLSLHYLGALPLSSVQSGLSMTIDWVDHKGQASQTIAQSTQTIPEHMGLVVSLTSPKRGDLGVHWLPVARSFARDDRVSPPNLWESLRLARVESLYASGRPDEAFMALHWVLQDLPRLRELTQLKVIEARIAAALGLEHHAATVLSRSVYQPSMPLSLDENAVWLHLAELNLHRQQLGMAARRLAKMRLPNSGAITALADQQHAAALAAQKQRLEQDIALRQGAISREDEALVVDTPAFSWALTVFNTASLHAREQRYQQAADTYQQLTSLPLSPGLLADDLFLALYDKAWLNLGYVYLSLDQPASALKAFQQIRLNSPWAIEGAMAVGWVKNQQGQYRDAVSPWLWLLRQPRVYPYTQAALLGVADMYEHQGSMVMAMTAYQQADQTYAQMLQDIRQFESLLKQQPLGEWLVLPKTVATARTERCHLPRLALTSWLGAEVASAGFQRDCLRLATVLQRQRALVAATASLSELLQTMPANQQRILPSSVTMFEQQIHILQSELQAMAEQLAQRLTTQMLAQLQAAYDKVSHYQLAARLALARIHDQRYEDQD